MEPPGKLLRQTSAVDRLNDCARLILGRDTTTINGTAVLFRLPRGHDVYIAPLLYARTASNLVSQKVDDGAPPYHPF